jgi:hypothetical protein
MKGISVTLQARGSYQKPGLDEPRILWIHEGYPNILSEYAGFGGFPI